jgi:hypothetical protein
MRGYLELRETEGLTYKALSARTGVKVATLARWQRVFREESSPPTRVSEESPPKTPSPFVELVVGNKPAPSPKISKWFEVLIEGMVIKVPFDFESAALAQLISVLRQAC